MTERAHVTSVDALESFRANLIVYLGKARPTLDEIGAEVLRTRLWIENDRRTFWEAQVRRRLKALEQAQQALFSARVSNLRQETSAELMALQRAKRALEEAEAKLRILKQWSREFDSRVEPLAKELQKLDKSRAYLVHCASGRRSTKSLETFKDLRFQSIYHLDGGIRAWQKAGQPVTKE